MNTLERVKHWASVQHCSVDRVKFKRRYCGYWKNRLIFYQVPNSTLLGEAMYVSISLWTRYSLGELG